MYTIKKKDLQRQQRGSLTKPSHNQRDSMNKSNLEIGLEHILPSYQLDLTIFAQSVSLNDRDITELGLLPPLYSQYLPSIDFGVETLEVAFQEDTILRELTSLEYEKSNEVSLEIIWKPSHEQPYTTDDVIHGVLKLQNFTNIYVSFESLLFTLEGRVTTRILPTSEGERHFKRKNFLTVVDFSASFTEADSLLNGDHQDLDPHHRSLPLNRKIPPNSSFERPFIFKIPKSILADDSESLIEDISLPPSMGHLNFLYPIDPQRQQDWNSFKQQKLDLTSLNHSISYSVNARLIKLNPMSKKRIISCHSEVFFNFVPTTGLHLFSLQPTQQLKLLLRLHEREVQIAKRQQEELSSDNPVSATSLEKSRIIAQNAKLTPSITDISKISYDDKLRFYEEARLWKKPNSRIFKLHRHSPAEAVFKILYSGFPGPFKLALDGESNIVKIDLQFSYDTLTQKEEGLELINDLVRLSSTISSHLKVGLGVNKIHSAKHPLSIDLDASWFLNKNTFDSSFKRPVLKAVNLQKSLPLGSVLPKRTVDYIRSFASFKSPERYIFYDALSMEIEEDKWAINQHNLLATKTVSVSLEFDSVFTSMYSIIPTFHTSQLARFYFLEVSLDLSKMLSKNFLIKFEGYTTCLDFRIPIDVIYDSSC